MRCSWSYYVIYTRWGRMQSLYSCKEKLPREYVNSKGRARNMEQYNTWCTYNGRSWEHTHYSSLTRFTFWWRRHNSLDKIFWDNHYAGVWKVVSNSLDIDCLHGVTRCRVWFMSGRTRGQRSISVTCYFHFAILCFTRQFQTFISIKTISDVVPELLNRLYMWNDIRKISILNT